MYKIFSFVLMAAENPKEHTKATKSKKVFQTDKYVCKFLKENWFCEEGISARSYGKQYGVNYHVIEKIQKEDGYNLPLSTLSTICFNKGIKLSDFFKQVEKRYGKFLNDTYFIKK